MSYRRYSLSSTGSYGTGTGGYGSIGKSYGYGSMGSDSGSVRSYSSGRSGYSAGGSGYGGLGRSTSGAYSTYDSSPSHYRSASQDRSLNYVSGNRGNVSSLRDRFVSTEPRERYHSLDRYGTRSSGDFGRTSSYTPDYGGHSSRSYGTGASQRSSSATRSSYAYTPTASVRDPSPGPSRLSRRDYGGSTTSLSSIGGGSTYSAGVGAGTSASRARASDYSLTPFTTRRSTASAKDYNLTPFSSRLGSKSTTDSKPSYSRQNSAPIPDVNKAKGDTLTIYSRAKSKELAEATAKEKVAEDSESAKEPSDDDERDLSITYMTSRGTHPKDKENELEYRRHTRREKEGDKRFLSRTKKKKVPTATLR